LRDTPHPRLFIDEYFSLGEKSIRHKMVFRAWIKTTDEHQNLEEAADNIMLKIMSEIRSCPGWQYASAVKAEEEAIDKTYRNLMNGTGSLTEFRQACERWKIAGLRKEVSTDESH